MAEIEERSLIGQKAPSVEMTTEAEAERQKQKQHQKQGQKQRRHPSGTARRMGHLKFLGGSLMQYATDRADLCGGGVKQPTAERVNLFGGGGTWE